MKDLALLAIDTCKQQGASYADIRLIETTQELLMVRNGQVALTDLTQSLGYGIRAFFKGAWGFCLFFKFNAFCHSKNSGSSRSYCKSVSKSFKNPFNSRS
jgi:predicted Zn-dependent protease